MDVNQVKAQLNQIRSAVDNIERLIDAPAPPTNPPVDPPSNPPTNPPVGSSDRTYDFKQKSNGQPLPDVAARNGYVKCFFPSHAIVSVPVHEYREGGIAGVECTLVDQNGDTVLRVIDHVGGFHPNYFNDPRRPQTFQNWLQGFKADGQFPNPQAKSNNHNPIFEGFVIEGYYTWHVRNSGSIPFQCNAGKIRRGNGQDQVSDVTLQPGESRSFPLAIFKGDYQDSDYDQFKMNVNAFHY